MLEQEQNRVATVTDIIWLHDALTEFLNKQAQMLGQALYDALALTLIELRDRLNALHLLPLDALQQSISEAISAGIPSPMTTTQEIPASDLQQLERIEGLWTLLAGDLPQIKGTIALLTQRKEVDSQQLATIVEGLKSMKNATPHTTPSRHSTGSSRVLHKKAATPDGKRVLIKEFFTQRPDASLNDCEQALGIERSTVSRIRKAFREAGELA